MFIMNKLDTKKRAQILNMLCEGLSMRSSLTALNTVSKLLVEAGNACAHDQKVMRNATKFGASHTASKKMSARP